MVALSHGPCRLGVNAADEAGRGPVLGAMVYACAFCAEDQESELKSKGFADSKVLKAETREAIMQEIQLDPLMGYMYDIIPARSISAKMLESSPVSLNVLACDSTFKIVKAVLEKGVNITKAFVDTLGDPDKHKERLSAQLPGIDFTVCKKADALYPIVSAASIVAKVTRDEDLIKTAEHLGLDPKLIGSGYPSDPGTVKFLQANVDPWFGYHELVRFSWSTCSKIMDEKCLKVSWMCEEELPKQQKLIRFAKRKIKAEPEVSSGAGRHSFFRVRKLERIAEHF